MHNGKKAVIKKEWVQAFDLFFADGAADRELNEQELLDIFRGTLLIRTVMMLEAKKVRGGTPEMDAIREMRNAIVHNQFDLSLNHEKKSFSLVSKYHGDLANGKIPDSNGSPLRSFFSLDGTILRFDCGPVHEACRQLIMKYI